MGVIQSAKDSAFALMDPHKTGGARHESRYCLLSCLDPPPQYRAYLSETGLYKIFSDIGSFYKFLSHSVYFGKKFSLRWTLAEFRLRLSHPGSNMLAFYMSYSLPSDYALLRASVVLITIFFSMSLLISMLELLAKSGRERHGKGTACAW